MQNNSMQNSRSSPKGSPSSKRDSRDRENKKKSSKNDWDWDDNDWDWKDDKYEPDWDDWGKSDWKNSKNDKKSKNSDKKKSSKNDWENDWYVKDEWDKHDWDNDKKNKSSKRSSSRDSKVPEKKWIRKSELQEERRDRDAKGNSKGKESYGPPMDSPGTLGDDDYYKGRIDSKGTSKNNQGKGKDSSKGGGKDDFHGKESSSYSKFDRPHSTEIMPNSPEKSEKGDIKGKGNGKDPYYYEEENFDYSGKGENYNYGERLIDSLEYYDEWDDDNYSAGKKGGMKKGVSNLSKDVLYGPVDPYYGGKKGTYTSSSPEDDW